MSRANSDKPVQHALPAPTQHTDKAYERELEELREKLLAMGGKVEAAIAGSVRAHHRARRRARPEQSGRTTWR